MRNVNLAIRSLTGKAPKNAGKVIQHNGVMILHQHVQNKWRRQNTDSWGINTAVLDYLEKHGISDIYLFNAGEERTYYTYAALLREYGVPSSRHDWGENINLPADEWNWLPGKLKTAWVHKDTVVMLQPKPLIVKENIPVKEVDDALAQSSFFRDIPA